MNPTTNTEAGAVADVAAKLTEAQHTALWNLGINAPDNGWMLAPHDGWRRAGQACTMLCGKDLSECRVMGRKAHYRLTPLGLAVRQHLEKGATAGVVEMNEQMFGQGKVK